MMSWVVLYKMFSPFIILRYNTIGILLHICIIRNFDEKKVPSSQDVDFSH